MPSYVLGLDGFTGAGLTLLQGREFDSGDLFWEVLTGSFSVQGGLCRVTNMVPTKSVAIVADVGPRDYIGSKVTFNPVLYDKIGAIARVQPDGTSYYLAYFSRPFVHLFRVDAGIATWIALGDVSGDLAAASSMELRCSGTAIQILWNDVLVVNQVEATYALGGAGIEVIEPLQWIDTYELTVDSATTTIPPTTVPPVTTEPPTTIPGPTTVPPTTILDPELTFPPTTIPPTTPAPTTVPVVTTTPPTTVPGPTTIPPTTIPVSDGDLVRASFHYIESEDRLIVDAWLVNTDEETNTEALDPEACTLDLIDELGATLSFTGVESAIGNWEARFVIDQARLYAEHLYLVKIALTVDGDPSVKGPAAFALPVT